MTTAASPTQNEKAQFDTGAVRDKRLGDRVRWDLLDSNDVALRRLAETFAEGYKKYGADNWKKGFPASELYNHAREHMLLWIGGDKSEDHLAHAVWNLCAIMWQEEKLTDQMDYPLNPANLDAQRIAEERRKHPLVTIATLQKEADRELHDLACPLFVGTVREGVEFHDQHKYQGTNNSNGRCVNCGSPKSLHRGFKFPISS